MQSKRWDDRYRSGEYGDKNPEPLVIEFANSLPAGRALDVASGLGRHSIWLATNGWHVTAVDYSEVALDILRQRGVGLPIDIARADLESPAFSLERNAYDLVCDCCFLWRPLFGPMKDSLRPGGLFLGVFPLAGDLTASRPTNAAYLVEPAEVLGFFAGWEIVHHFEGRPHRDSTRRLRAEIAARKPS